MKNNSFQKLVEVVDVLHSPKGCPWDRKQKVSNIKNYILEEVYELCDAIDVKDPELIKEEIGDLFLLLVTFSYMFKEKKLFGVDDALEAITRKLIVRHPHVFSRKKLKTSKAVLNMWIKSKSRKKKRKSIYDRIPKSSPALLSSFLFLKEYRHLGRGSRQPFQEGLAESIALYKKTASPKALTDMIFNAACLLSSGSRNPEALVKKKVRRVSSKVLYDRRTSGKKK